MFELVGIILLNDRGRVLAAILDRTCCILLAPTHRHGPHIIPFKALADLPLS